MTAPAVHDVDTCPWVLFTTRGTARYRFACGGESGADVTLLGASDYDLRGHIERDAGPVELSSLATATLLMETGAGRVQICADPADIGTLRVGTRSEVADVLSQWLEWIDSGAMVTLPSIHRDLQAAVSALYDQEDSAVVVVPHIEPVTEDV